MKQVLCPALKTPMYIEDSSTLEELCDYLKRHAKELLLLFDVMSCEFVIKDNTIYITGDDDLATCNVITLPITPLYDAATEAEMYKEYEDTKNDLIAWFRAER